MTSTETASPPRSLTDGTSFHHPAFRAARWLLLATVLVPVVIDPKAWFPFVTTRAIFFRVVVELATACLLALALRHDTRASFRRDPIFLALLGFTIATTIATVFSPAPWRSVFGEYGRMGGLWGWLHLFAFYVALRTFFDRAEWRRYLRAVVGVALAVAAYGVIQYYQDVLGIPWEGSGGGAIHATVGNSGLLAIYLGLSFALLLVLRLLDPARRRIPYLLAGLTLIFAIFLAQNRSTLLGGVAGLGAGLVTYGLLIRPRRRLVLAAGVGMFGAGLLLPLLTSVPAVARVVSTVPLGARLSQGVDQTRVLQWHAALNGIRERPLLGYGPENYHLVWSRFGDPEMLRHIDDVLIWDRAHNAYLDVLATTGAFGLLAFLALWSVIGWTIISGARRGSLTPLEGAVLIGLTVWYAVYLFFWFFDLNSTMLWIAVAAYVAARTSGQPLIRFEARLPARFQSSLILAGGALALAATLYIHGYETLRLTRVLRRIATATQPPLAMLSDFNTAFASRAPDTHETFLLYSTYLRTLLPKFPEMRQDPALHAALDAAFTRAFTAVELETRRDRLNERTALQKARIALLAWAYYGDVRFREIGVASLHHAAELAPTRVGVRIALASALETDRQFDSALAQLEQARELNSSYGPTSRAIASLYLNAGRPEIAARWMRHAFTQGSVENRSQIATLAEDLVHRGQHAAADSLLSAYFSRKYGPLFVWPAALEDSLTLKDEWRLGRIWSETLHRRGEPARAQRVTSAMAQWCLGMDPGDGAEIDLPGSRFQIAWWTVDRLSVERFAGCRSYVRRKTAGGGFPLRGASPPQEVPHSCDVRAFPCWKSLSLLR